MISKRALFAGLAGVATLQTALLAKIVCDRHTLIKNGREIVLPVVPVDPRDLMRGDYVILGYDIGLMRRMDLIGGGDVATLNRGDVIYVTLQPDPVIRWKAFAASTKSPSSVADDNVVLKGRVVYNYGYGSQGRSSPDLSVRYGIESYFVQEGTGKKIELDIREKKVEAILAVGSDGTAALKGIVVGGERHEDPPIL